MANKQRSVGDADIVAPEISEIERLVPDLPNWPASWSYEDEDVPFGQALVEVFKPFIKHLLTLAYSRKTLVRHRDHLWLLGGQLVKIRQVYPELISVEARSLVLAKINEFGGPIDPHLSEAEHDAFDATCRKFYRFLCADSIPHTAIDRGVKPRINRSRKLKQVR